MDANQFIPSVALQSCAAVMRMDLDHREWFGPYVIDSCYCLLYYVDSMARYSIR
jgi:hypothetical protein